MVNQNKYEYIEKNYSRNQKIPIFIIYKPISSLVENTARSHISS